MTTNIFNAMSTVDIVKILYDKTGIKANVMISYPYLEGNASKATKVYRGIIGKLYLDSGAFSSFTGKFKVSRHEYALYLKRYGHLFDEYFNLDDKFDDAAHNLENQYYLEGELGDVRKPIPVIHDPENPFMELQVYAEMGHNYILLSALWERKRGLIRRSWIRLKKNIQTSKFIFSVIWIGRSWRNIVRIQQIHHRGLN